MPLFFLRFPRMRRSGHSSAGYARLLPLLSPLLALLLLISVAASQLLRLSFAQAVDTTQTVAFPAALSPRLIQSQSIGPMPVERRVTLSIGLQPRHQKELTNYVQAIERQHAGSLKRFLTLDQYIRQFSPDQKIYDNLRQFLETNGFTITQTYPHRLFIDFSGTIEQVQRLFHVLIMRYKTLDGEYYYTNTTAPQIPSWLAGSLVSINGLTSRPSWSRSVPPLVQENTTKLSGKLPVNWCPGPSLEGVFSQQQEPIASLRNMVQKMQKGGKYTFTLIERSLFQLDDLLSYLACLGERQTSIEKYSTIQGVSQQFTGSGDSTEVKIDIVLLLQAIADKASTSNIKIYQTDQSDTSYLSAWGHLLQDSPSLILTAWKQSKGDVAPQINQQERVLSEGASVLGFSVLQS